MAKDKLTYSEKLKSPLWQRKRLEILERDNWRCQWCGENEKTLHVHHRRYIPGKEPWEVPSDLLVTLCADCHENETSEMDGNMHDLICMIKDKFLAGDVRALAEAFHNLQPYHCAEVFATVIKYWFSNPEKVKQMYDEYFEHLTNKQNSPF